MRFSNVIMAYFLVGGMMWGGGVIAFDEFGVGGIIFDDVNDDGTVDRNSQVENRTGNLGGPIAQAVNAAGGSLLAAWNIIVLFAGLLFWPVTVLIAVNAPPQVLVVGGGMFVVAFLLAMARILRGTV